MVSSGYSGYNGGGSATTIGIGTPYICICCHGSIRCAARTSTRTICRPTAHCFWKIVVQYELRVLPPVSEQFLREVDFCLHW